MKNSAKLINVLRSIAPVAVVVIIAAALMVAFGGTLISMLGKPESIKVFVEQSGAYGALVFVALQMLQIIIAVIPGEPVQIAGGYIFGTLGGFVLSTVGIMAGSVISFLIARRFGMPVIRNFASEAKLSEYKKKLESEKGLTALFILCLIPGVPKDVLVYAAGLTPIRFRKFFAVYFVARIPAMLMASYMGAQLGQNNVAVFVAVGAAAALLLAAGYIFRQRIYSIIKL